ncbi:MAG: DUF2059 domain-containing protein [Alphaproteobacteria bacterium]|nr:DUF2059 domain-containing protein [Alphaproteobacteria bacterium]
MKTSSRRLLLPILFLAVFAAAPATSSATTSIEIRRELADRFLEILFEERYLGRLLNVAFDGLPVVGGKDFASEVEGEIDKDQVHEALKNILVENYSSDELRAMVDFYGSPTGRSILSKRPRILKQVNEIVQVELIRAIRAIMEQEKQ